jgi:hypothetical protein
LVAVVVVGRREKRPNLMTGYWPNPTEKETNTFEIYYWPNLTRKRRQKLLIRTFLIRHILSK